MQASHKDSTLKIAYYGDDFTGATDTLATAARAGLRTLLFLGLPTATQLERAGPLDCLGIAGAARAMTPAEMQLELEPVGRLFAALGAPVMHYKTCSTFDSAPHIGSIGAALRILRPHAGNALVPIVGGQPNLHRYCVFGNLFAGTGNGGAIHRLDRHPTMRQHPVTPMHEADLRLHLAQQGLENLSAIAYPDYAQLDEALDRQLDALLAQGPDAVLFDIAHPDNLAAVGRLIWQHARRQRLLAAGPSSVVQALAAHWQSGAGPARTAIAPAQGPVLVLAGSLSPLTARQVKAATSYEHIALDAPRLAGDENYRMQMARQIATRLDQGAHVLACTSGADGATVSTSSSTSSSPTDGRALAQACGDLLAHVLATRPIRRLGIAGGDTSSHAVQALQAWGLSYRAPLAPGVALCRLHSEQASLDGLEIMLKGGQMGGETLFEELLAGTPLPV
ncbi:four-carbon acid sugar kinase family protein [Polaromonas sp. JS666]|uniref:four-carbon acid sugar kinase family protein n=1 Tax=Polaromonas sp. (strain JS666 / ATCC BAA-500) TaxID=296591 RepID=UPI0000463CC2|nr:four-carbon acid sugar kinase family protein [Polaromonas sp. JS666]ABE41998.1 type III effector Hrp-dependent outers domain protein [Polaromonas sp. JS666]